MTNKNKKEQLAIELDLEKLEIDVSKVNDNLLDLIYNFISDVYSNINDNEKIINNDLLNSYTESLIQEGKDNVIKKDA